MLGTAVQLIGQQISILRHYIANELKQNDLLNAMTAMIHHWGPT